MKIYLIRHGRTTANEEKRYSGKQDVLLSRNGVIELRKVKESLSHLDGTPVFLSTLTRTRQTKDILLPSSEIKGKLSFMNETNFGDFEGKTYTDLKEDKNYLRWITDVTNEVPLNGESYTVFKNRVIENFVEHIKELNQDTVYITHGGVIRMIMSQLLDTSKDFFEWSIPNGLGYMLEFNGTDFVGYQTL